MSKKALITGIAGQDGSYLAEFLLEKGYEVHGIVRDIRNVPDYLTNCHLHTGDLTDEARLYALISEIRPMEIYNLGAQSSVGRSFEEPAKTSDINALGALRLLEAIKQIDPTMKFYQASSSEMFGHPITTPPYDENTLLRPRSPYAYSKVFAYHATRQYRDSYGIFACNGILFNHESPRRGEQFVTRKITKGVARIKAGLQDKLVLGNLSACRDWGYAPEYVEAMWLMMQQDKPDDYVVATGQANTIKDFLVEAFRCVGIEDWENYVDFDDSLLRANEVDITVGNSGKAKQLLGWEPKVRFNELVKIMVEADQKDSKDQINSRVT